MKGVKLGRMLEDGPGVSYAYVPDLDPMTILACLLSFAAIFLLCAIVEAISNAPLLISLFIRLLAKS